MARKSISGLLEKKKEELKPEKKSSVHESFITQLNKALKVQGLKAKAVLGGSLAKQTHLKGKYDADIFVKFSKEYPDSKISSLLEKTLKSMNLKYEVLHGSRDYFQVEKETIYEVIPVLEVKPRETPVNVADMSPLHVDYFNKKASGSTRGEVRLLKAFLQAQGLYGAESHIKGFSGHVVDLLILHYKTFLSLLRKASKWKSQTIIDMEKHQENPLMALNESKIGPLIIIDPVQKQRNAAAAVSREAYDEFRVLSKKFLEKPSLEWFEKKPFAQIVEEHKKTRNSKTFLVEIKPLKTKRDVAGAKALKIKEFLEETLSGKGFTLLKSDWDFSEEKAMVILTIKNQVLPEKEKITGPLLEMEAHAGKFREKHGKAWSEKGRLYAERKRKHVKPETLLRETIKSSYVKEKCESLKISSA